MRTDRSGAGCFASLISPPGPFWLDATAVCLFVPLPTFPVTRAASTSPRSTFPAAFWSTLTSTASALHSTASLWVALPSPRSTVTHRREHGGQFGIVEFLVTVLVELRHHLSGHSGWVAGSWPMPLWTRPLPPLSLRALPLFIAVRPLSMAFNRDRDCQDQGSSCRDVFHSFPF